MKSSTLPQYISNPSLIEKNRKQQDLHDEEITTSANSSPYKTKKIQHAKSHGELYQPNLSLSISPVKKTTNNENEIKYSSDSPKSLTNRTATATVNSSSIPHSSPPHKIPLWKRFKQMIVPTKRNKEQQYSSSKIPTLLLNELSENKSSKKLKYIFIFSNGI
jgi:hypothetical protein